MPRGIYKRKLKPLFKKGEKYSKLTAVKFIGRNKKQTQLWLFRCDCGNEKIIRSDAVLGGHTKSCGCLQVEFNVNRLSNHNRSRTKTYRAWVSLKSRCTDKKLKCYKNYGGRGITYSKRWEKFENFYKDMGDRPSSKHSIDRIDNDGNYCKENCKWATQIEQQNNKRNNHFLDYNGISMTISQWSVETGLTINKIYGRLRLGWSVEKTLSKK